MTYTAQRDRILVHAKAAALAADPKFSNVAIGMPSIEGSKGVRIFYGGEDDPPKMPGNRVLTAELIGEHVSLVAWWAMGAKGTSLGKSIDDQMFAFKHALRTAVTAEQTLNGEAVGVDMDYAEPDVVTVAGARYALLGCDFTVALTEYPY